MMQLEKKEKIIYNQFLTQIQVLIMLVALTIKLVLNINMPNQLINQTRQ